MKKPITISYSSHSRFKECSEKFWLSKEYKSDIIPSPLIFGKAIELSVDALLLGAADIEKALFMFETEWSKYQHDDMIEYLASDVDCSYILPEDIIKYDLKYGKLEEVPAKKLSWICCAIRGRTLIKAFYNKIMPKISIYTYNNTPCSQIEISLSNKDGDKITGFIDYVLKHQDHKDLIITDLKTSSRPYTNEQIINSEQLKTYVADRGSQFNTSTGAYIVLVKKLIKVKTCNICKGPPKNSFLKNCPDCLGGRYVVTSLDANVQFIYKDFNNQDLQSQLDDYSNTIRQIKEGTREKNTRSCFSFSRRCEFYEYCHEGKNLDKISGLVPKNSLISKDKE